MFYVCTTCTYVHLHVARSQAAPNFSRLKIGSDLGTRLCMQEDEWVSIATFFMNIFLVGLSVIDNIIAIVAIAYMHSGRGMVGANESPPPPLWAASNTKVRMIG